MVAVGQPFISNPDLLVNRICFDDPPAAVDATTIYGGAEGITDYPAFGASDAGSGPVESPRTLLDTAVRTLQP